MTTQHLTTEAARYCPACDTELAPSEAHYCADCNADLEAHIPATGGDALFDGGFPTLLGGDVDDDGEQSQDEEYYLPLLNEDATETRLEDYQSRADRFA